LILLNKEKPSHSQRWCVVLSSFPASGFRRFTRLLLVRTAPMFPQALFLLFENASGYALFERVESESIGAMTPEVIATQTDLARFSKLVRMKAFLPFVSAEQALENQNDISEGILNDNLRGFLEQNLDKAKPGKLTKYKLGVTDVKIGQAIQEEMQISCVNDELVLELMRYIPTLSGLRDS
jgi:nucleolar protein 56